jgi:hypothetical protein
VLYILPGSTDYGDYQAAQQKGKEKEVLRNRIVESYKVSTDPNFS